MVSLQAKPEVNRDDIVSVVFLGLTKIPPEL